MAEQLHTIPIADAMAQAGECPFCYIERRVENHAMDYVLGHGASYMEADIRELTDTQGFCRSHFKKMFDYGNSLGNAWILKTLTARHINEMTKEFKAFDVNTSEKKGFGGLGGLFSGNKKTTAPTATANEMGASVASNNSLINWINRRESTCFICTSVENSFNAYTKTFFTMYKKDEGFRKQVAQTKGFCLDHFKNVCEAADTYLSGDVRKEFYDMLLPLMTENMNRIYEDISWFIEKYDYKNKDADWKDSRDAIQRTMQKLRGGDPSLPAHVIKK